MLSKKTPIWISVFILMAFVFSLQPSRSFAAASPEELESLFKSGKYNDALQLLEASPESTAPYHYNLGTLYFKLGKLGPAVAHLEKSNHQEPHNIQTQRNLKLARTSLADTLGGVDKLDPSSSWIEQLSDRVNLDEVRGILGLMGCLLLLLWIKRYRKTRRLRSTLVQPSAICTLLFLFISLVLYVAERTSHSTPPAVALAPISVRSGPGQEFLELVQIPAGVKVRILDRKVTKEPWVQVRYASEGVGWAPESSLLLF